MKTGLIEKYRQFLPVSFETPVVTLGEGDTPLLYAPSLTALTDGKIEVYLKYEGVNPTGSFKDRGMTLAVSKALEEGSKGVICASTGNTSASAAAYAARAKLPCYVVLPDGKIALGKLVQALLHGAIVIAVEGNFDVALTLVRQIAEEEKIKCSRGGLMPGGIRVHSVRLPGFVAHQEIIFGDKGQTLTIKHDSISRECFMPGVLMAIRAVIRLEGVVYGLENLIFE